MPRSQKHRKNDKIDQLRAMINAPSTIDQLRERSGESTIYESLANLLAEPAYAHLDVATKLRVGTVCASGGYSDVYDGELMVGTVNEPVLRQISKNKKKFSAYLNENPIPFKAVAVKRSRPFLVFNESSARAISRELRMWAKLKHPNILPLLGFTLVDNSPSLVSEWMDNSTLTRFLSRNDQVDVVLMACYIASGLNYLHTKGIVHGDLKSDNILVSHDGRPVLSDFGFSRTVIGNTIWTGTTPMKGNVRWMAYELLIPQTRTNESLMDSRHQFHTKESDIWAFGMITYELLCGKLPYYNLVYDVQVMSAIVAGETPIEPESYKYDAPKALWGICVQCWNMEPDERPKASQLLDNIVHIISPSALRDLPPELKREFYQRSCAGFFQRCSQQNIVDITPLSALRDLPPEFKREIYRRFCAGLFQRCSQQNIVDIIPPSALRDLPPEFKRETYRRFGAGLFQRIHGAKY